MPVSAETARRYDEVPYESHAFHETHPDHLAVIATLHGLEPPPVATSRVLELGCAGGGNLLPMALEMPEARFVGIDVSARQIDEANAGLQALGVGNVEFRASDLAEIGEDVGTFDYVIAHGVYSWVSEPVRERLLALIRATLAPTGVAFVSYNTRPGWNILGILRELMLFHAGEIEDLKGAVHSSRELLDRVVGAMPEPNTPYSVAIRREVEQLRSKSDPYLLHEFLEPESHAVGVHEFVAHAARHGLEYLSDARLRTTVDNQPPQVPRPARIPVRRSDPSGTVPRLHPQPDVSPHPAGPVGCGGAGGVRTVAGRDAPSARRGLAVLTTLG